MIADFSGITGIILTNILKTSELRSFAFLATLMILASVLEAIGVSIVIPVVNVLIDREAATKYEVLRPILSNLPDGIESWQIFAIASLCGVFLIKSLFVTVVHWYQFRTVLAIEARLAQDLYKHYLSTDYVRSKDLKVADVSNHVVRATTTFSTSVVLSVLTIFSECCVLVAIFSILIYFEPVGTFLVFSTLIFFGGLFYYSARSRMESWGNQRLKNEALCFEDIRDGMSGLKEIKLLNCEGYFTESFTRHSGKSSQSARHYLFVQQLPRVWLEVIAVLGISLLLGFLLSSGRQSNEILPIISAFGLAALRMLPSASKIISSITNIKFGSAATRTIKSALNMRNEKREEFYKTNSTVDQYRLTNQLRLVDVSFSYSTRSIPALTDLNLCINRGDVIGIIGESGSGKSTFVDLLLGLLYPDSGHIEIDGKNLSEANLRIWQSQIGYVAQTTYLLDKSIMENVALGLPIARINVAAVNSALKAAQLLDFVNSLPLGLQTPLGENGATLSGGQRQRVGIARALYKDPEVLILDEATSALDLETEESLISAISKVSKEKTILLISHRQSTLRICNRIFEVRNGRICEVPNQIQE